VGTASLLTMPNIATAKKTESSQTIVGAGEHQYEVDHNWAQLPDKYTWQTTHNVAVGTEGLLYVIHEGRLDQDSHPSIFAFDGEGKLVRAFGEQFQGGGHGIEVRHESGEDFLYVCAYQQQRSIAKLTAMGEEVWRQGAPMESGRYANGEDVYPVQGQNHWGRDRFLPTNIAFHPDGGFFLADGYGAWCIHYYDDDAKWIRSFGALSDGEKADGTFNLPHGVWIDPREDEPLVVVADRVNARLQWFTTDGEHVRTLGDFLLPANVDIFGDTMVVPDLVGRVTLLDKENQVIAHLGEDSQRMQADNKYSIRSDESTWLDGKFIHPHDACFDEEGNLYVAEWVARGRVTKLRRLT
ncbi:MAG: peptidase, partial [Aeoliella sp.]